MYEQLRYKQLHVLLLVLLTGTASGDCSIGFDKPSVYQIPGCFSNFSKQQHIIACGKYENPLITRVRMMSVDSSISLTPSSLIEETADIGITSSACFDSGKVSIKSKCEYYRWGLIHDR